MRVKVMLSSDNTISLSSGYNRAIQGCIYSLLKSEFRDRLHDEGFVYGKRQFKLFTFSRLFGKFVRKGSLIEFDKKVSLFISSPVNEFIEQVCSGLLNSSIRIELNALRVEEIEFVKMPILRTPAIVRTLSPVTVYSTLYTPKAEKKTYYYSPFEKEFSQLIYNNLIKKAKLIGLDTGGRFEIEPLKVKEAFVNFKGTLIRGWNGSFKVEGSDSLLSVAYEAGLGSKNSAGFGMIEVSAK